MLVNNAGVMLLGPVEGADTEQWRRMIDVNCLGLLYCTHAALPVMREEGAGHIVNVSSVAGRVAALGSARLQPDQVRRRRFSEALRQEALHANIRVTIVEPGLRRDRAAGPQRGQPDRHGGDREDARADASRSRPRTSPTRSSTR